MSAAFYVNNVKIPDDRATVTDKAWQTHCAAVEERDPPPTAVDAEIRILFHHPDVTPERDPHPAPHRRPRHCSDHGLAELESRGT